MQLSEKFPPLRLGDLRLRRFLPERAERFQAFDRQSVIQDRRALCRFR